MTWDNKWPAVAALATVATLFIPFLVPLLTPILGLDTKGLTVETVSTAILVDLSDPTLSSLKLTYKDVPVSRLTVATIEVRNSGTRPIERADFEGPIVLRFKNPIDVLAVTPTEKKTPQDLKPVISSDVSGITIAPLLLNSGDTFRITVQLRGDFNEPTVEARISGVPSISRQIFHASDDHMKLGLFQLYIGAGTALMYFYFIILISYHFRCSRPFTLVPLPESLAVVVTMGFGSAGLIAGAINTLGLELSGVEIISGCAIFGLLCMSMLSPFVQRRNSRLLPLLKP